MKYFKLTHGTTHNAKWDIWYSMVIHSYQYHWSFWRDRWWSKWCQRSHQLCHQYSYPKWKRNGSTSDLKVDGAHYQYTIHNLNEDRFQMLSHLHDGRPFPIGGEKVKTDTFLPDYPFVIYTFFCQQNGKFRFYFVKRESNIFRVWQNSIRKPH